MNIFAAAKRISALAAVATFVALGDQAAAQIQQDDLIIGVSSNQTNSFRIVRAGSGADPGVTSGGGVIGASTPWSVPYMQSVAFDNANQISHNANGNLLAANFGNGFTGFEVHNFATNGSGTSQSLWSIKTATGGARTDRGGGLSVSPDNTKIAWAGYDGGLMHVMQYDAGATPGTGGGAAITGWIETAAGDGNGNAGGLPPYAPSVSQGSTWLDNNTVLGLSAFGELVSLDVSAATFGSIDAPSQTAGWKIEKEGVFAGAPGNAQFTDIFYNEQIAPNIIIGSAGFFSGGSVTQVFVWDKTTFNQIAKVDLSTSSQTGREISLDSAGNLYVGGFGNQIVSVIDDFVGKATAGTLSDNSSVAWFTNDFFASYSGLDVASSMPMGGGPAGPGDFDGNGMVNDADLEEWQSGYGVEGGYDGADFLEWQQNYGAGAASPAVAAVPEPTTAALGAIGIAASLAASRRWRME